jgi:hypothetical protein
VRQAMVETRAGRESPARADRCLLGVPMTRSAMARCAALAGPGRRSCGGHTHPDEQARLLLTTVFGFTLAVERFAPSPVPSPCLCRPQNVSTRLRRDGAVSSM